MMMMMMMSRLLRKMKSLVDDKKLRERDDLSQRLSKAESNITDKDDRITVSRVFTFSLERFLK